MTFIHNHFIKKRYIEKRIPIEAIGQKTGRRRSFRTQNAALSTKIITNPSWS